MLRIAMLLLLIAAAACGGDEPCKSGEILIAAPMPSAPNPAAKTAMCWPAGKPLPDGAVRIE